MRVMHDFDRSWFDFTPAEAFDLAMRLAPLSSEIKFEVRLHTDEGADVSRLLPVVGKR
jgi:hypothetical protein